MAGFLRLSPSASAPLGVTERGPATGAGAPGPPHWFQAHGAHCSVYLTGRLEARAGEGRPEGNPADALLAGFRARREGVFQALTGPFAAVVVERDAARGPALWLHREVLGRRLMFYVERPGGELWIAAALEPLLASAALSRALDECYLADHFALRPPPGDGRTPFAAIKALLPGQTLCWNGDAPHSRRLPLPAAAPAVSTLDESAAARELRARLQLAVERALAEREGRPGILLSSGLDSAPLAVLAQSALAAAGERLLAIAWSLPDFPEADETEAIRAAAAAAGVELRLVPVRAVPSMLGGWPLTAEYPGANAFRFLKSACYEEAARLGCGTLLSGATGDALYPHPRHRILDALRHREPLIAAQELAHDLRFGGLRALREDPGVRGPLRRLARGPARPATPPAWAGPRLRELWYRTATPFPPEARAHPRPEQARAVLGLHSCDGVPIEDRMARAFGLELRQPLHDPDLVAFFLATPSHRFYRRGHLKYLTRLALAGILPDPLRWAPRRGVLTTVFDALLRTNRRELRALLTDPGACWDRYLARDWLLGALAAARPSATEGLLLWHAAAFELWRARYGGA